MLIDSPSLCYRIFHVQSLRDLGGPYIIAGFLLELLDILRQEVKENTGYDLSSIKEGSPFTIYESCSLVFCWDSKKSFRRIMYPQYKQGRGPSEDEQEAREDLYSQMNLLRTDVLPSCGFKNVFIQPGLESDDLIAKIVQQEQKEHVTIITTDQDLYQMVSPTCVWKDPWSKKSMMHSLFEHLFGVHPQDWHKIIALTGCKSDNVEGINGIGLVSAIKFLRGRLEGARKEAIQTHMDTYERNLALVKLPHPRTQAIHLTKDEVSFQKLKETVLRYNMRGILKDRLDNWKAFCALVG